MAIKYHDEGLLKSSQTYRKSLGWMSVVIKSTVIPVWHDVQRWNILLLCIRRIRFKWSWLPTKCSLMPFSTMRICNGQVIRNLAAIRPAAKEECRHSWVGHRFQRRCDPTSTLNNTLLLCHRWGSTRATVRGVTSIIHTRKGRPSEIWWDAVGPTISRVGTYSESTKTLCWERATKISVSVLNLYDESGDPFPFLFLTGICRVVVYGPTWAVTRMGTNGKLWFVMKNRVGRKETETNLCTQTFCALEILYRFLVYYII